MSAVATCLIAVGIAAQTGTVHLPDAGGPANRGAGIVQAQEATESLSPSTAPSPSPSPQPPPAPAPPPPKKHGH